MPSSSSLDPSSPLALAAPVASAAQVLTELHQAGVQVDLQHGQLVLRGPGHVVPPALLARVQAETPALLRLLAGAFREEVQAWGVQRRALYEERAGILEFDGGFEHDEAERTAYLEVREAEVDERQAEETPLTADEAEELFSWPAWAQGRWQLEAEHRLSQGAYRPTAERQAFEILRNHLRGEEPAWHEEPPRCTNPRCERAPNLLGLRACPSCGRARQGVGPKRKAHPSRAGAVREVREADGLRWSCGLGAGASIEGFVPLEALVLAPDQCPSCRARVQPGPGGCPHCGVPLPEGFGEELEDTTEEEVPAPGVRLDRRPVVSPLTCGGCGCKALGDGGQGACERCGWRRKTGPV